MGPARVPGAAATKAAGKKKSQNEAGEGSPRMRGSGEGEAMFSASRQPGAEDGLA